VLELIQRKGGKAIVQNIDDKQWKSLKQKLARAKQISSPAMGEPEKEYVLSRGTDILRLHATDFVKKRLAAAAPKNDGRQTPLKGHPVFIAQHATGTSDREKLEKFHGIKAGSELSEKDVAYVVSVILRWIQEQVEDPA
jgi:hypothetical protein